METTGMRIKAARIAAGLTQAELADKVGVKYSAIHKYEAGLVVNLKRDTIARLASALNVNPSYLLCIDEGTPAIESDDGQNKNIVKIAGRDGSYIEKRLSDSDIELLLQMIDRLPDASDDL